jgi:hypothetical protein
MKSALWPSILAITALGVLPAGEADAKPRPIDETLWEKAVADNAKEADKAYAAYQKALEAANAKVIKALEASIKELNDPKRFGGVGVKERAAAISALEARIESVKQGELGTAIVANRSSDLLGEPAGIERALIGAWKLGNMAITWEFMAGGKCTSSAGNSAGTWKRVGDEVQLTWSTGETGTISLKGKVLSVRNFAGTFELSPKQP